MPRQRFINCSPMTKCVLRRLDLIKRCLISLKSDSISGFFMIELNKKGEVRALVFNYLIKYFIEAGSAQKFAVDEIRQKWQSNLCWPRLEKLCALFSNNIEG